MLDGGRAHQDGRPPEKISFDGHEVANFRRTEPSVTLLGAEQKNWWKRTMAASTATWKVWAASNGTLDWRADPQNLPEGLTRPWPGRGYACFGGGDLGGMYRERAELYEFVRDRAIDGFVTVSGDRHSFWAGYAASTLPPSVNSVACIMLSRRDRTATSTWRSGKPTCLPSNDCLSPAATLQPIPKALPNGTGCCSTRPATPSTCTAS